MIAKVRTSPIAAAAHSMAVCLQELKSPDEKFPITSIEKAGYGALWQGQSRWNGVAILARGREPVETCRSLPGDPRDGQARYLEAAIEGVLVGCIYAPNGNPMPGPKFEYKLAWLDRLIAHARRLLTAKCPVVLTGDYNVIPEERDVYKPERWLNDALFQPEARDRYRLLLEEGWTDAVRHLNPDERIYTFWKYWRDAFQQNSGIRIDHFLLSPDAAARLAEAGVDREIRAREHPSDHAPVWIELS